MRAPRRRYPGRVGPLWRDLHRHNSANHTKFRDTADPLDVRGEGRHGPAASPYIRGAAVRSGEHFELEGAGRVDSVVAEGVVDGEHGGVLVGDGGDDVSDEWVASAEDGDHLGFDGQAEAVAAVRGDYAGVLLKGAWGGQRGEIHLGERGDLAGGGEGGDGEQSAVSADH